MDNPDYRPEVAAHQAELAVLRAENERLKVCLDAAYVSLEQRPVRDGQRRDVLRSPLERRASPGLPW